MLIGLYKVNANGVEISLADLGIFDFPDLWHRATFIISFLKFLIAIVIVSLTASEYSNRTLKQNLIDGLSKKELILSKFYLVLSLALIVTFLVFIVCLILGLLNSDFTEPGIIFRDLEYLGAFFISHLTFFCMCLFAGILVKRSAFALGFIGIWAIIESILQGVINYIDFIYKTQLWDNIADFLPITSTWYLITEPFSKISVVKSGIETISQGEFEKDYGVQWINVIVCLLWSVVFVYWSFALLKRRDL
jgi:ABC-type transport system involved in multi-copper enzyme maturation permease subunit